VTSKPIYEHEVNQRKDMKLKCKQRDSRSQAALAAISTNSIFNFYFIWCFDGAW